MRTAFAMVGALAVTGLLAASSVHAQTPCVGDCDGTGSVAINELILGVNISLGFQPVTACEAFDCMNNDMVGIACLIQGVNNSLFGCAGGPTRTPTRTGGATPTVTPGVRERVFTIGSNMAFGVGGCCGSDCNNQMAGVAACLSDSDCTAPLECAPGLDVSRTGLFNGSPLGNTNAADVFAPGPLTLVLGAPNSMGVAPLSMKEDVLLFANVFGGAGCFCLKLFAEDSSGSIDCDGGTPYDTEVAQASGQSSGWTVTTGLGAAAGPGNGNLLVTGQLKFIAGIPCDQTDCATQELDPPAQFPFTTTNAIALKGPCDPPMAGCLQLTNRGEAFDCENFEESGSGGVLAAGGAITIEPVGDTADTIRLGE